MLLSDNVKKLVDEEYSAFFTALSFLPITKLTEDTLSLVKPVNEIELIRKYLSGNEIAGKKLLNVGSGFGIFNLVAIKNFNIDAFGIEPDGEGFGNSLAISREVFRDNNLDENTLTAAFGEEMPFDDNTFDIVYSTNVMEHVKDPFKVLDEGLRVLKPGGILQYVYPSFHSFFDGHYAVFHPPVLFKSFFPWYIKYIAGRNEAYAKTLNVELNARWAKNATKKLGSKYNIELLSLGEEVFLERMTSTNFGEWAGLYKVKKMLDIMKTLGLNKLVAQLIIKTKTWSPVILTIKKQS